MADLRTLADARERIERKRAWLAEVRAVWPSAHEGSAGLMEDTTIVLAEVDRLTAERTELMDAFAEYIDAVEAARKGYHNSTLWHLDGHDDRIEAAAQRLYNLQTPTEAPK